MSAIWFGHSPVLRDSVIHRLPAAFKLAVALFTILATVLVPLAFTGWFVGVGVFLLLVIWLSRLSLIFLLQRLLWLSALVLGVVLVNALQPATRGIWLGITLRSMLCLLTVLLLSNTTPFSRIVRVLEYLRLPALLITTLALMHRYLFVLSDEAERMRRARASRSFTPRRRFQWPVLASVVGQLFVRASERAERIYDAMCARGWK